MRIIDNFLDNPEAVRENALNSEYIDWKGYDGQVYKRICIAEIPELKEKVENIMGPCHFLGQGFRLNYSGEMPNQAIHTDLGWGTYALVLYLNKPEDCRGGTGFYRHIETNTYGVNANDFKTLDKLKNDWDDLSKWQMIDQAYMKFNRVVIYRSDTYHSRYPFEAFGDSPDNGRLIAVAFFTPKEG